MNKIRTITLVLLLGSSALGLDRPWQNLSDPTAAEVAANFMDPPPEYSMTLYWGWEGRVTREVIARDLDEYRSKNVMAVTIEAGTRMEAKYLSPEWFDLIRYTVEQARQRGMRIWLVDEGKYPSGFAGGKFTEERPDLTMQTFRVADEFPVAGGESIDRDVAENTICAVATKQGSDSSVVIEAKSGRLTWTAPEGQWQVQIVEQQHRTSATRSVNNPKVGAKDGTHALCDYLNPEAVVQFIAWTHEQYKAVVGDEFGRTVLGFRGDEPDYGITPWTVDIIAEFHQKKGYDVRPYLPSFVAMRGTVPTEAQRRAKADYWDVWSDRFGRTFFGRQGQWCAANNVEYLVHLNHEDDLPGLARSEGDFFRCMRPVQMPGVDAIWDQIWPGKVSDFPKLASSASHLFGRPRSFTESFAAYRPAPNAEQAEWILNQQLVRGINMVEVMWVSASTRGRSGLRGWLADERFSAIAKYLNRVCYVLSQGRPTAKIALYQPTMSLWLGDREAHGSMLAATQKLLEHQRDLDFVDDDSIASTLTLDGNEMKNLSGQGYGAVVIPSVTAMSKAALDKLKAFAAAGGKVIILGRKPSMVVGKTFLNAEAPADLSWAMHEPSGELTDAVLAALPRPDVALGEPCPDIKYSHRRLSDADVYFLFNEGDQEQSIAMTLAGTGEVQTWDAFSGTTTEMPASAMGAGKVQIAVSLKPYETRLLIVGRAP
ncbi:MAG: beta-galactosidase [Phycisphaerae bacterium]|nr:beta-galactosidase [Phycisphaerae bacterium]